MKKYSKKGISLGEGFPAVLALVLIGIIVIIAIYIFMTLTTNLPSTTVTVTNETAWLNGTGYVLANSSSCNAKNPSIVYLYNVTNGKPMASGNYTVTVVDGIWTLQNLTDRVQNTNVSVVYTFGWGDQACLAANTSAVQFGTYPALIGLIGTIIFLALIIGVLIGAFVGRAKGA